MYPISYVLCRVCTLCTPADESTATFDWVFFWDAKMVAKMIDLPVDPWKWHMTSLPSPRSQNQSFCSTHKINCIACRVAYHTLYIASVATLTRIETTRRKKKCSGSRIST